MLASAPSQYAALAAVGIAEGNTVSQLAHHVAEPRGEGLVQAHRNDLLDFQGMESEVNNRGNLPHPAPQHDDQAVQPQMQSRLGGQVPADPPAEPLMDERDEFLRILDSLYGDK